MFLTCSSNFKLLQNVTPRSLADTTRMIQDTLQLATKCVFQAQNIAKRQNRPSWIAGKGPRKKWENRKSRQKRGEGWETCCNGPGGLDVSGINQQLICMCIICICFGALCLCTVQYSFMWLVCFNFLCFLYHIILNKDEYIMCASTKALVELL